MRKRVGKVGRYRVRDWREIAKFLPAYLWSFLRTGELRPLWWLVRPGAKLVVLRHDLGKQTSSTVEANCYRLQSLVERYERRFGRRLMISGEAH